jgi:DNA (cytosine-5)-methyltransferase 1
VTDAEKGKGQSPTVVPAIDLFAGPGGLSEGFSCFHGDRIRFDIRLSIEKELTACKTLALRSFVREFRGQKLPKEYYQYIKGDASKLATLKTMPQWSRVGKHVRQWTLGEQDPQCVGYVHPRELHQTIHDALNGARSWILLGGPPCQAYSIVGRSRMTGLGVAGRNKELSSTKREALRTERADKFASDLRHSLYREYLRVVAVHQPPVFVMENVKGILSARLPNDNGKAGMFSRIRQDLEDPWNALKYDPDYQMLNELRTMFGTGRRKYRLRSFVLPGDLFSEPANSDFLIKAECYGVPQNRHRVIVLGIRDDIHKTCHPLVVAKTVSVRDMLEGMPAIRSMLSSERRTRDTYGEDSPTNWCAAIANEVRPILKEIENQKVRERLDELSKRTLTTFSPGRGFMPSAVDLSRLPESLKLFLADPHLNGVIQHCSRAHMAADLARYAFLSTSAAASPGKDSPKLKEWPKSLLPEHANVRHLRGRNVVDGFFDRFRVQVWDRPSSTVTSHLHKDGHYFIHPDPRQCRSLTVREAARLQTFPENYFFEGNRTQQFIQVGNAVPPYLAVQLAASVAELISATN